MKKQDQRHYDRGKTGQRSHLSTLAFLLAGLLIALTSASLAFVGYVASNASKRQAIANEKQLFQNTLATHRAHIVHEQLTVARRDATVENVVRNFSYEFVHQQIETLWSGYQHDRVLIVSDGNRVLAESFQDYTHITDRPLSDTPAYTPLIEKARALFLSNQVRVPGGYSHRSLQGLVISDYAAVGFIEVDGHPALASAIPVIPDQETVTLPTATPTILVSAKFIDEKLLSELNAQLSFVDLTFRPDVIANPESPSRFIRDAKDAPLGSFTWRSQSQNHSTSIWPTVIPVILGLSFLLAVLAFGIAWRIGKLTTSLQASERQNKYLALHDPLSGLANRLQLSRALEAVITRKPGARFALLHCDLDKFKQVNDTYGHAAGDEVIKVVAKRLKDIVEPGGLVARQGGDEFVILFTKFTDRGRLTLLSGRLIGAVKKPIPLKNGEVAEVGLSIGVATAPNRGDNAEALMASADAALYYSKENGRGQTAFAEDMNKTPSPPEKTKEPAQKPETAEPDRASNAA